MTFAGQAAQPIQPLGNLAMFFLPVLRFLFRGQSRKLLERRVALTLKLQDRAKAEKIVKAELAKEAKEYWQIIEGALARMGQAYIPMQDHQSASGQKKGKVQHVRVEICYTTPELIYYKILTRRRTLFGTKNALPYHVYLGDLIQDNVLRELAWACHRVVSAVHEDPRFGVWLRVHRLEGVGGLPVKVPFSSILEHYPEDMTAGTLVLGVGAQRKIHSVNLATHPHVLIAGSTGSGKSNMVNQLIAGLMMFTNPRELKFILIDLKRMEFKLFRDSGHLYRPENAEEDHPPIISEAPQAINVLKALVGEIESRAKLMEHTDVKEIAAWNEQYPDQALPRLICIIDEFAELRLASDKTISDEAARLVNRACNLGRAVGVHIWICTQRPARAVLGNEVKINMPLILAGRTMSGAQSAVILDNGHAADLPQVPGRMLYQSGSNEFEIQTPYIGVDDIKQAVKISRGRAAGVVTMEGVDPVIIRDGLIRLVFEENLPLNGSAIDKLLSTFAITHKMYREFCQELIKAGRIEAGGNVYTIQKQGAAYYLVLDAPIIVEQPPEEAKPMLALVPLTPEQEQAANAAKALEYWRHMKESRGA